MLELKCKKCGSSSYELRTDKRNCQQAWCRDCGSFIKALTMVEYGSLFHDEIAELTEENERLEAELREARAVTARLNSDERPLCRWCTENYGFKMGLSWVPMDDVQFCPRCGRKLKPSDRNY